MSEALQVVQPRQSIQPSQRSVDLFRPTSFMEALEFAKVLAESQMVPKQYIGKPYAIIATWQYGLELGVGLMQALQGISNINGTPAVFGDLGWALVQNHPDFVDSVEEVTDTYATCTLKRRGRADKTWKYTLEMARVAGLTGKDNWKNNPKRMLQWRARSWTMRDQFPDSLKGMVMADEAMDYPDAIEGNAQQPYAAAVEEQSQVVDDHEIGADGAMGFWAFAKENGRHKDTVVAFLKTNEIPDTRKILASKLEDLKQKLLKDTQPTLAVAAAPSPTSPDPGENMDAEPA